MTDQRYSDAYRFLSRAFMLVALWWSFVPKYEAAVFCGVCSVAFELWAVGLDGRDG